MGTRATIRFKDGEEEYFVYRGHDGFPDNVLADINETLEKVKGRWSGGEVGCLVSLFFAFTYVPGHRLPIYDLTRGFHGDESYKYFVEWDGKKYKVSVE